MGRSRRKELEAMIRPIPGEDHLLPARIFAPSPSSGGARRASFLQIWKNTERTDNPSLTPQGPPKWEDGEDNPEAAAIEDIALGQIGKDLQGHSFQVLEVEGDPPARVLLRSVEREEVFWSDLSTEPTLLFDSLSYRRLSRSFLQRLARGGDPVQFLWQMREGGFFDLEVQDRQMRITLVGDWILRYGRDALGDQIESAEKFASPRIARVVAERFAENVETYPAIEDFYRRMQARSLPLPGSRAEELRQEALRFLLLDKEKNELLREIEEEASRQKEKADELLRLALLIREATGLPSFHDPFFLQRVAPLWRQVSLAKL